MFVLTRLCNITIVYQYEHNDVMHPCNVLALVMHLTQVEKSIDMQ